MTAEGIGFTDESVVLEGDALLTLGVQFTGQQFVLQLFDDGREGLV